MDHAPEISIIVCSDGRRDGLAALFGSFARLVLPESGAAEVILVDNSPRRALQPAFERLCQDLVLPARYEAEPRPGLAMAQNRGLEVARGEIIAFTDDDCLVAENWLLCLGDHFRRDPALQGLGGRIELRDPADFPVTIRTGLDAEDLDAPDQLFGFLHGCNMAFRRSLFDRIGPFDSRFGAGSVIGSGSDTEFVYRAFKAGCRIAYRPDVLVFHDHGRRRWRQVRSLVNRYQSANGMHRRTGRDASELAASHPRFLPLGLPHSHQSGGGAEGHRPGLARHRMRRSPPWLVTPPSATLMKHRGIAKTLCSGCGP